MYYKSPKYNERDIKAIDFMTIVNILCHNYKLKSSIRYSYKYNDTKYLVRQNNKFVYNDTKTGGVFTLDEIYDEVIRNVKVNHRPYDHFIKTSLFSFILSTKYNDILITVSGNNHISINIGSDGIYYIMVNLEKGYYVCETVDDIIMLIDDYLINKDK